MLAPSGGGLILYQAYGNLYAMTERGDGLTGIKRRRRDLSGDGVTGYWRQRLNIMPPTLMTQSAGRLTTASRGRETGGRASRGGRTRGRSGDQGDGRIDGQDGQVGGLGNQGRGQGNGRNQNGDAVNDNIRGDVSRGCTYKEFLACNPKEYDGKGGAIVYTRWIEKMESVQDMSGCRDNQKVKYTAGSFVGISWEDFKTLTREEFCPSNEMQKLETELWNHAMVGAGHAAYTDRFHELARLVSHLVTPEGKRIESPLLSYGDGMYAFNLWMKQFSLMWLASSSASSNSPILIFYFFIYFYFYFYFFFYEATS
ncbi:reverse transcriptase domain-containing protein [Tanacetum coccineum]|uniref:Reverse transcriptase domain-containing protein n=1 Tax=Tanacetum coccineum TaxID=301880 RepID=A0ABQ4YET6_9ASTR